MKASASSYIKQNASNENIAISTRESVPKLEDFGLKNQGGIGGESA